MWDGLTPLQQTSGRWTEHVTESTLLTAAWRLWSERMCHPIGASQVSEPLVTSQSPDAHRFVVVSSCKLHVRGEFAVRLG